ncbi:hypothetical protein E4U17_001517 [Claviceps sp. LM77 group G4]|nr:hypothetical protein E4U17_001517 [Claviceps sp. LM77 group G4]
MAEGMIKTSREGGQVGDDDDDKGNEYEDRHRSELLENMAGEGTEDEESEEEDVGLGRCILISVNYSRTACGLCPSRYHTLSWPTTNIPNPNMLFAASSLDLS